MIYFTFKNYISLDAIEFLKKKSPELLDKIDFAGFGNLPLFQYLASRRPDFPIEAWPDISREAAFHYEMVLRMPTPISSW